MENLSYEEIVKKFGGQSELLRAIGHPVRLCILNGLIQNKGSNVNHMQCCLSMPQSTISTHLAKLRAAGAIVCERDGKEIVYSVKDKKIVKLIKLLGEVE